MITMFVPLLLILSFVQLRMDQPMRIQDKSAGTTATATFGAGCFWSTEAIFERIPGVQSVVSGYAGGLEENPTDREVNSGSTGHAQVVQITFDTSVVNFDKLLEVFWKSHDPTTPNRQGADVGPHYRSIILYQNENQRLAAEQSKRNAQRLFGDSIVTEIVPLASFYDAKEYHQDFYQKNPNAPYCRRTIQPKLKKLNLRED